LSRTRPSATESADPFEVLWESREEVRHLLVRGPAMSGKRTWAAGFLSRRECTPLWVTTTDTAAQVRSDVGRPEMCVVDAVTRQSGTLPDDEDGDLTWYATSPADLTGLGMRVSAALSSVVEEATPPPVVFVDSVSTLLLYADLERVYRFLHVLNNRVDALDGRSVHLLHTDGTDGEDMATLIQLYSHVLEVRRDGGGTEYRVSGRGIPASESDWRRRE
jgi:hypothetical protein